MGATRFFGERGDDEQRVSRRVSFDDGVRLLLATMIGHCVTAAAQGDESAQEIVEDWAQFFQDHPSVLNCHRARVQPGAPDIIKPKRKHRRVSDETEF